MCVYTHAYISIYTGIREQVGCNSGFQCRVSMGLIGIGGVLQSRKRENAKTLRLNMPCEFE